MTLSDLKNNFTSPFFWNYQVERAFPYENGKNINVQLYRMSKRGDIIRIKRGMFCFPTTVKDQASEFVLAQLLYESSYVSLESALNLYGVIPDVPQNVTSVSPITTKKIYTKIGTFFYSKIKTSLYFGYVKVDDANSLYHYKMALPEKAFLDYIYIRKIRNLESSRIDRSKLKSSTLKKFSESYPKWVQKVIHE